MRALAVVADEGADAAPVGAVARVAAEAPFKTSPETAYFGFCLQPEYSSNMLATQIRQKDGMFYFASFKARDVLRRVRFTSRFYFEGEAIEAEADMDDPIAKFIGSVEKSDKAFQRLMSRRKIRDIVNFYESAETQPAIPGTVLLFSEEVLGF
jgi:hypothetical protein